MQFFKRKKENTKLDEGSFYESVCVRANAYRVDSYVCIYGGSLLKAPLIIEYSVLEYRRYDSVA